MDILFSKPPQSTLQTNHILTLAAHLYRLNILADESRICAHTSDLIPRIHALTDKSSIIQYHQTGKAGCVRITDNRIRWAPTVDGSQQAPELDIDISTLASSREKRFTLVIDHCEGPDGRVKVMEKSARQEYLNGDYDNGEGIRIIDAAHFKSRKFMWRDPITLQPSFTPIPDGITFYERVDPDDADYDYDKSHFITSGLRFLSEELTAREAEALKRDLTKNVLTLDHDQMQKLVKAVYGRVSDMSLAAQEYMREKSQE